MVDLWSVIHWAFWAFFASTISAVWEPPLWVHVVYTLTASYGWEGYEYWAQRKWPARWSNRIEPWYNSWLSDPIFNMAGTLFGWYVVAYYRKHYWIWKRER